MKRACVLLLLATPGATDAASVSAGAAAGNKEAAALKPNLRHHRAPAPPATAGQALDQQKLQQTEAVIVDTAKLPPVPGPADTGPDGFPQLPAVANMLNDAEQTMKTINEQAGSLEKHVIQAQMEKAAKMERQKAVFEKRLHAQEQDNLNLVSMNSNITSEIATLKSQNAAISKHAGELQASNRQMRSELKALRSKLGGAGAFAAESLAATDDSHAEELAILDPHSAAAEEAAFGAAPPTQAASQSTVEASLAAASVELPSAPAASAAHHHHGHKKHHVEPAAAPPPAATDLDEDAEEEEDEDDDDDEDGAAASLLAVSSRTRRVAASSESAVAERVLAELEKEAPVETPGSSNPHDLLGVLQQGVESLQRQERESESKLKAIFLRDFQAGAKRHTVLTAHQEGLNATRASLKSTQAKLRAAEARLESTKGNLEQRIRGLGLYLQKLAHLALAPPAEVPRLVEALPSNVSAAPLAAPAAAAAH